MATADDGSSGNLRFSLNIHVPVKPLIMYFICIVRGSSLIKLGSLLWCKITIIICWDNRNYLQRISLDNRNDTF